MKIKLRTAALEDLEVIHAIRRAAILGIAAGAKRTDLQEWADLRSPEYYAERVAAGELVIAHADDDDAGWGSSSNEWVTGLYVQPAWCRQGVGRTIMSRLESEIARRGMACVRLAASPNAVGFYTGLGYAVVGPPEGDGAVPMEKSLQAT